jgi:hypothetical protein
MRARIPAIQPTGGGAADEGGDVFGDWWLS